MNTATNTAVQIISAEEADLLPVEENPNNSIRFKVTGKCPWSCRFCHKEGGWEDLATAKWGKNSEAAFSNLAQRGYKEVHFTGGEPTVNANLPEITRALKEFGYKVKMTSILGADGAQIAKIAKAGLDGVNISIHTDFSDVDPEKDYVPDHVAQEIAHVQINKTAATARHQVLNLVRGLAIMQEHEVDVKANAVVSSIEDIERATKIYQYAKAIGIGLRFLPDLRPSQRKVSHETIRRLLDTIGAQPTRIKTSKGSSDITVYFVDSDGYEFGVKLIADVLLPSICRGCPTQKHGDCTEKYYGIRLEEIRRNGSQEGIYHVRLCLHEKNPSTIVPLDEFFSSPQFQEIVKNCL